MIAPGFCRAASSRSLHLSILLLQKIMKDCKPPRDLSFVRSSSLDQFWPKSSAALLDAASSFKHEGTRRKARINFNKAPRCLSTSQQKCPLPSASAQSPLLLRPRANGTAQERQLLFQQLVLFFTSPQLILQSFKGF